MEHDSPPVHKLKDKFSIFVKKIFAVVGASVTLIWVCIQLYEWVWKEDYRLDIDAYQLDLVLPKGIAEMQDQNSAFKILFTYLKKTKNIVSVEEIPVDSVHHKLFDYRLANEQNGRSNYHFMFDTSITLPVNHFHFTFLNKFYVIDLYNSGNNQINNIKIHNLSRQGYYEILERGFDVAAGFLPHSEIKEHSLFLGSLAPKEHLKMMVWDHQSNVEIYFGNRKQVIYLSHDNGVPTELKFQSPQFIDWPKTNALILLFSFLMIVVVVLSFLLYRNKRKRTFYNSSSLAHEVANRDVKQKEITPDV